MLSQVNQNHLFSYPWFHECLSPYYSGRRAQRITKINPKSYANSRLEGQHFSVWVMVTIDSLGDVLINQDGEGGPVG